MPIAMSSKEWERIKKWTNPQLEDPEVAQRREYVEFLNAASNEMTKHWPNSLENMNKRNEELRQARIKIAEEANSKFYKKYLKRQKAAEELLMYSARDTVFKNKDAPKMLLGAVIESVTLHERNIQLQFLQQCRREAAELKKKDDDDIIRMAKEWHEHMAHRKQLRFEANKRHQQEILQQAHELAERTRSEHEAEINQQKLDNEEAAKEMAAIKRFEGYMKKAEKERIFKDMMMAKEAYDERKREQMAREKLDDQLIDVLNRSRARVEARRKQTEKAAREERMRRMDEISAKLRSGSEADAAKEKAAFDKACREVLAAEEARRLSDQRKKDRIFQERQEIQQQFLRDQAQRLHELNTKRQWELMDRFKNVELYKEYQEKLRKEEEDRVQAHKEETLRLLQERDDRDARELAERRYFYGELAEKKLRESDNKVLTYAARLLEECRQHGRPELPLQRIIDKYCKMYRLYPSPPLPASLAAHFKTYKPFDGSRPDPDYVEPPPPEGYRSPKTAASASVHDTAPESKRDGLHSPAKPGPSKPAVDMQVEEYKRKGPANGLQERNLQSTLKVSEIQIVPCKTLACKCELKPK